MQSQAEAEARELLTDQLEELARQGGQPRSHHTRQDGQDRPPRADSLSAAVQA